MEAPWVDCLAFSHDGKLLATGAGGPFAAPHRNSGEIKVWDVASGKLLSAWKGHNANAIALAFAVDGKTLVAVEKDLRQLHWNRSTEKVERTIPAPPHGGLGRAVLRADFSADGKQLGACDRREGLVVDAQTGKVLFRHKQTIAGSGSILSHGLRLVAATNHQDVDLWDVRSGKLVDSLLDHPGMVLVLAFDKKDRHLAVGYSRSDGEFNQTNELCVWDLARRRKKWVVGLEDLECWRLSWSPAGDLLAVSGRLGPSGPQGLRLFETASGRELARLRLPGVVFAWHPTFRADGKMLALACDNTVRLWTIHRSPSPGGKRERE
jgi:WD40 repeat protein